MFDMLLLGLVPGLVIVIHVSCMILCFLQSYQCQIGTTDSGVSIGTSAWGVVYIQSLEVKWC